MAAYKDLWQLAGNGDLEQRLAVAICVKAAAIVAEASPTVTRLAWAEAAFAAPEAEARRVLRYVLAVNKDQTIAAILGATDAAIQANCDTAINKLHP